MSFSSDVKEELAKQISKSRHCQLAELAGIIELSGRINEKTKGLELDTENLLLLNKYATLMKRAFGTDTTKALDEQDTGKILAALKITAQPVNRQTADGLLLMQTCCKRAFIRGAFMAAGSISDPNKAYHFEIVCHTKEQAKQLQELLCGFDTDAKIVEQQGALCSVHKGGCPHRGQSQHHGGVCVTHEAGKCAHIKGNAQQCKP